MSTDTEIKKEKDRPTFDYFSAKNFAKLEANAQVVDKELDRFKNDYSTSKLNKVYEKYELLDEEDADEIKTQVKPKSNFEFNKIIKQQNSFNEVEETLTYQKVERDPKVKLNLTKRAKLAVATYSFVTALLGFLLIYNAFAIGNINSNINNLNESIANEQINVSRVIKDIGNMTDEDNVLDMAADLSFSEIPMNSVVNVTLYQKQSPPNYKRQTNWFDTICNFFSNLLGG